MAARTKKVALTESWKQKIQISQIINRLVSHFNGDVELSREQIATAKILLSKVVPDLKAVDNTVHGELGLYQVSAEERRKRIAELASKLQL